MPLATTGTDSGPVLDVPASVVSNTASDYYVAPFIASLDTSGSAVLTAVQLQNVAVAIANIQRTFKLTLTDVQTAAFLNAFTVSKSGADLTVTLDKPSFETVMDAVIENALDEATDAIPADTANGIKGRLAKPASKVANWLSHGLKNTLVDYILRTLKVSAVVSEAPVTVNAASAASKSMSTGISASSDVLESVYLQIKQETLELYKDDNIPTTNALPLKGGDKMVFVFDTAPLTISTTVTESQVSSGATTGGGGANVSAAGLVPKAPGTVDPVTGKYTQGATGTIVMTDTYRVAFELTMAGSSAYTLSAAGVAPGPTELRGVAKTYWNF